MTSPREVCASIPCPCHSHTAVLQAAGARGGCPGECGVDPGCPCLRLWPHPGHWVWMLWSGDGRSEGQWGVGPGGISQTPHPRWAGEGPCPRSRCLSCGHPSQTGCLCHATRSGLGLLPLAAFWSPQSPRGRPGDLSPASHVSRTLFAPESSPGGSWGPADRDQPGLLGLTCHWPTLPHAALFLSQTWVPLAPQLPCTPPLTPGPCFRPTRGIGATCLRRRVWGWAPGLPWGASPGLPKGGPQDSGPRGSVGGLGPAGM